MEGRERREGGREGERERGRESEGGEGSGGWSEGLVGLGGEGVGWIDGLGLRISDIGRCLGTVLHLHLHLRLRISRYNLKIFCTTEGSSWLHGS